MTNLSITYEKLRKQLGDLAKHGTACIHYFDLRLISETV